MCPLDIQQFSTTHTIITIQDISVNVEFFFGVIHNLISQLKDDLNMGHVNGDFRTTVKEVFIQLL